MTTLVWPDVFPVERTLSPHRRQDKLEITEDEGILHEVKLFPCCLQEKCPCSCP